MSINFIRLLNDISIAHSKQTSLFVELCAYCTCVQDLLQLADIYKIISFLVCDVL